MQISVSSLLLSYFYYSFYNYYFVHLINQWNEDKSENPASENSNQMPTLVQPLVRLF